MISVWHSVITRDNECQMSFEARATQEQTSIWPDHFLYSSNDDTLHHDAASLEVYPRPDGDCYVNGFKGDEGLVAEQPDEEEVVDEDIELMKEAMHQASSQLGDRVIEPHIQQCTACYWPEIPDGLPCIGPTIHGIKGAFVTAGHPVWGILQGP
eukprot:scaffold98426_cov70-Attheya_sp.AAC.7